MDDNCPFCEKEVKWENNQGKKFCKCLSCNVMASCDCFECGGCGENDYLYWRTDEAEVKEASCFPCHQKQTESTIHK